MSEAGDANSGGSLFGLVFGLTGFLGVLFARDLWAISDPVLPWLLILAAGVLYLLQRRRRISPAIAKVAGGVSAALGITILFAGGLLSMPPPALRTFAVTFLMASWWITVAIPIPATSLLPLVLFPVLGVMKSGNVAVNYADNNIFLFMGGFIIALGMERWDLHRRIALHIVHRVGTNPSRMVLGFMVATAVLSMWISNTATSLMMLPIALAVIASLSGMGRGGPALGSALLIGIAYAASIGGLATPIGTPPNIILLSTLKKLHPNAPPISFGSWLYAFLPLVAVFLPVAWLILTRVVHRVPRGEVAEAREYVRREIRRLGPMSGPEWEMVFVFGITALLWMFRKDIVIGDFRIPGWSGALEHLTGGIFKAAYIHDATVAMAMACLMFLLPAGEGKKGKRRPLMDWPTARKLPWGILLLFGGGFALAAAFKESGLSRFLGEAFARHVAGSSPVVLVGGTSGLMTFLTEVTSNTATTQVMLPVLDSVSKAMSVNPLVLMIPATLSASCAFMLPIATPPNAIVFGSGKIKMRDMVRAGILLNLVGIVLVTLFFFLVAAPILGIHPGHVPAWALR